MISIDFTILLVILNFVVLLFILNKLLYKPISKFLADRQAKIAQEKEDASNAKLKAQELADQRDVELKNAAEEIRVLKKTAQKEAEANADGIIQDARTREKKILSDAEIQLQHEKEKAVVEVKEQLAAMIANFSEKFLSSKIDKDEDNKLIRTLLSRGTSEK